MDKISCDKHNCDQCDKSFASTALANRHKKTSHFNKLKYSCPDCNYFASRSDTLKKHQIRKHLCDISFDDNNIISTPDKQDSSSMAGNLNAILSNLDTLDTKSLLRISGILDKKVGRGNTPAITLQSANTTQTVSKPLNTGPPPHITSVAPSITNDLPQANYIPSFQQQQQAYPQPMNMNYSYVASLQEPLNTFIPPPQPTASVSTPISKPIYNNRAPFHNGYSSYNPIVTSTSTFVGQPFAPSYVCNMANSVATTYAANTTAMITQNNDTPVYLPRSQTQQFSVNSTSIPADSIFSSNSHFKPVNPSGTSFNSSTKTVVSWAQNSAPSIHKPKSTYNMSPTPGRLYWANSEGYLTEVKFKAYEVYQADANGKLDKIGL